MTGFLHWRKTTWALVLWSAATATWSAVGGPGVVLLGLLWLAGAAGLFAVWFMTRPPYYRGRGFGDGLLVRPGRGQWRVLNLNRTFSRSE